MIQCPCGLWFYCITRAFKICIWCETKAVREMEQS